MRGKPRTKVESRHRKECHRGRGTSGGQHDANRSTQSSETVAPGSLRPMVQAALGTSAAHAVGRHEVPCLAEQVALAFRPRPRPGPGNAKRLNMNTLYNNISTWGRGKTNPILDGAGAWRRRRGTRRAVCFSESLKPLALQLQSKNCFDAGLCVTDRSLLASHRPLCVRRIRSLPMVPVQPEDNSGAS